MTKKLACQITEDEELGYQTQFAQNRNQQKFLRTRKQNDHKQIKAN